MTDPYSANDTAPLNPPTPTPAPAGRELSEAAGYHALAAAAVRFPYTPDDLEAAAAMLLGVANWIRRNPEP